mgnify:CR=1 FL=1
MPSWKIHVYIGNKIRKELKVNRKYFMIGNLLPDQDRYNIKNLKKNIPRYITHFINKDECKIGINLPNYEKMYSKYQNKFKNPVLLGYLVHLLTDYYFNNYIYENYFIKDDNVPVPADAATFTLLKEQLEEVLGTLTEREQKVLTLRFGLEDGRARTLEEVGKEFNVTRERIRQIEAKALRKLRHPSRSRKLKDYLE